MSNYKLRAEKQAEWAKEQQAMSIERARLEARSMWEKIEEAKDASDFREILHEFAIKLGLED